jgi:signal transduction histidine kinase
MVQSKIMTPIWHPRSIWQRLIEPPKMIQDVEQRRQYVLLSATALALIPVSMAFPMGILPLLTNPENPLQTPVFAIGFFALIVLITSYILSRMGQYSLSASALVGIVIFGPFLGVITDNSSEQVYAGLMNISFSAGLVAIMLFRGRRALIITLLANLACILLLPVLQLGYGFQDIIMLTSTASVLSLLIWLFDLHRSVIERDRQAALGAALQSAKTANTELESVNSELKSANAIARESVRLKSEFLATMSHELRTPLNAIRGFTSIMIEGMGGEIDDEARHMVERINANGDRLLTLINDILDIAKIEAGRMELVDEILTPTQLTEQWQMQMSVLAEQRGLNFEVHVDPRLPETLHGDSTRITQVATNLLSNAFKFTKEGTVTLDVKHAANNTWQIVVSDTGSGIPPHALNYIFEEFRQVDGSSMRAYGGSGLGLAIVRNICRLMEGKIDVTSELGKGSTFTVTLPLVTDVEVEKAVAL